ncbi:MAG TPA: TonB-dependent receptor [Thermoanaerobaculia bacterium]|nr:TonB-dependent receptor [Thermoanaerobaculia bacterium]
MLEPTLFRSPSSSTRRRAAGQCGGATRVLSACLAVGFALLAAAPAAGAEIRGRVVTGAERAAVTGAAVEVVGEEASTRSADDGGFVLDAALPALLLVTHPLFEPATLRVEEAGEVELRLDRRTAFRETLLVQAQEIGDRFSPESIASAAFDPLDVAFDPGSVAEAVTSVAGVVENGQGGIFQTVSIRGVARQRVLSLISGARLTSERRAGVSASFLDPLLIGEIDVLRGPASTYYGSGALGGAIQLQPREFETLTASAGYQSQGDENQLSVGWGDRRWSLGVARRAADDAEDADRDRLFSRFDQTSATLRRRAELGTTSFDVLVVGGYGTDLGKPNTELPERATRYPSERHLLTRLAVSGGDRWRLNAFVHPHDLETEVTETETRELVDNETFDLGLFFEHVLPFGDRMSGRAGVDYFGRRGVDAVETALDLASGDVTRSQTLDGASEDEASAFAVLNWSWGRTQLEVGGRLTALHQENDAPGLDGSRSREAFTGFVGLAAPLGDRVQVVVNAGTGLRFPSLSEQFFSGATGRGDVIGNEHLEEESSFNADVGIRWFGDRSYLGASVFRNEIDDYIDRAEIAPDVLTFVNLLSGTIEGVEVDGFLDLRTGFPLRLEWAGHVMDGESNEGEPLADIPPAGVRLGARAQPGRFATHAELSWRDAKDDPGSGEKAIGEAWIFGARLGYELSDALEVWIQGTNLLDDLYFPSPDRRAAPAVGRSVGVGVRYRR